MERLQQLQRDGTTMNAVGSERNNNNSLDDNVSAILNGKLELMVIDIVKRTILPIIEPLIRRTVKEEIDVALEKVLPSMNLNSANEASTSQSRSLQLQFLNKISLPVWTGRKIEGEGNTPIEVALVDTSTGKIVSSGPEAEAKVEIVVLEGDCGDEEFNSKIVREWEGKKSILRGNNYLKLKEGIGFVNEITFAHNSEWMKNHKFRLGGTVRDAIFGTIIKGAKTEPFTVKDWRSTLKGKNYPPLASDEVWRLEKIHKHGAYHDRLRTAKINTVKEFLTLFSINPERLQKILRVGTDAKVWKVMVDHAQTCIVDEGVYLYHDPSYEQKTGVVFNAAGDLLGLVIESQYFQVNGLPEGKKLDGQKSMLSATEHWEEVICLNNDASLIQSATVVISVQSPSQVDLMDSNRRTRPPTNDHAQPMSSSKSPRQSLNDSNCRTPRAQPSHSPRQSLSYSNYTIPAPTNDHSQPRSSCQSPRQSLNDSNCMTPPPVNDHAQISQSPRQSLSNSNWTPPPTTDQSHPRSSSQQNLSDSNGRTPPPSSVHSQPSQSPKRALSYSNCRTPPPTNDHAQPRSSSKSPRQSLSDSNCRTPPLSNDHAEPSGSSQLFTQKTLRDFNSRTLPLNNDHAQLSGSSQVIGGGTNSLSICEPNCEDNLARLFGTCPSPDWVFEEEFLRSYLYDHNLQSQIPNIEMHYEQPCSAGSMLVVKEEVELALKKHLTTMKWNSGKDMHFSESRILQLKFLSALSLPVFTGTRIEGDDCNTLKVGLIDADTGKIVYSGLESSAKVEIVVLEGNFDGEIGDRWTLEEFKSNVVKEWEGKKPLLNGDTVLYLKEGIGLVGDISFTDNSSWTRSRKFRLGARIVDDCGRIRVIEAKTESFIVRDHRGELYKKHHPPSLFDEVWRLEKIGNEGAFHKRLSREKVKTVKDFLVLLFLDPTKLRNILGTGMSGKMWEVTVEHAKTCVLDNMMYLYCPVPLQRNGVVFNTVGQLLGFLSDSTYRPADKISEIEKADAQKLIITAFQHPEKVVPYEDMTSLINGFSCLTDDPLHQLNSPIVRSDSSTIIATNKKDSFGQPSGQPSDETIPSIYSMGATSSLDEFGLSGMESLRFDQPLTFQSQVSNSLICDTVSLNEGFCEDDNPYQYFDNYTPSFVSEDSLPDSFLFPRTAYRRWRMLSNVIKMLLILRDGRNVISCSNQE